VEISPSKGLEGVLLPEGIATPREVGKRTLAWLDHGTDPYANPACSIPLPGLAKHVGETVVLELHFHDAGAGQHEASLRWGAASIAPSLRAGYTRCNTETDRFTALEFTLPAAAAEAEVPALVVTGLQYPLRVILKPKQEADYWKRVRKALPRMVSSKKVKPLVETPKGMRLVTTTGIDVTGGFEALETSLAEIEEFGPLAKALGMTSIEGYVTWKRLEPNKEGEFDWTFYDAIVKKLKEYDLKFFPLLIVGSGYALPEWFIASKENVGFKCLEHGLENAVQSIWCPTHTRHVERVLKAFGEHYGPMNVLEAVRLGPSGNYGESQYPAGGNWGPKGAAMHIHIGWWAGDDYAHAAFRDFARTKYGTVEALNTAWDAMFASLDEVKCVMPETMTSRRQRADFTQWYTDSMTDWCDYWGGVVRKALPDTPIYQSAGGWGFREAGTEYSAQASGMIPIGGGIRLTNETDSYEQNVYATRLGATAAKLYDLPLGYEPASSHTARGTAGRIFNTLTTNGDHLFTYQGNLFGTQLSIQKWIDYVPLFATRRPSLVEIAVYYPETENQIEDAAFRHLYAWGFNPRAAAVRRVTDADYLDDFLLRQGHLDKYKVLIVPWGSLVEGDVQEKMDAWLRAGGTLIYHNYPRGPMQTVEGDSKIFQRWAAGDTGAGTFIRFRSDMEPPRIYEEFLKKTLLGIETLHPWTRTAIAAERPEQVYLSVQDDGHALVLNYTASPAKVTLGETQALVVEPYGIGRVALQKE
jgi:hypothetical protein